MNQHFKFISFLKNRKGNSLLLATATAIATTMGIYFFVTLTSLSEDNKQRVSHLYNAYIIGQSIHNLISGGPENKDYFSNGKQITSHSHSLRLDESFHNGEFVTLNTLMEKSALLDTNDPTSTQRSGVDTKYNKTSSGARIKYLDSDGNVINNSSTLVYDIAFFVNLAGTTDANSNTPYSGGDPFFYIIMDTTEDSALGYELTIDTALHTKGILSNHDGGIQAATSVILPQDNE